ncbi:CDP-alcohol phosphatidyltransferase family protein [Bathymodiolus japonicus methanotrophic gill symbiont]|uniref:CDP-alcohol phosphatidyltransferase family protein n=1 Tax=Bathymodiolus japonicus methanotrophic gill symbiont TaxID=113269 RepID=UPI0030844EEB
MGDALNALRPQRLRTKAASSLLPHWLDGYSECNSCSSRVLLAHVESANCPVAYQGLKITTSLSYVSMIFIEGISITTEKSLPNKEQPGTILSYVNDVPNLCSLAGLACTLLAIYTSIIGVYAITMIGMIWAVAFDWADGLIARSMKGRTKQQGVFGGQLDVLIDIVSYGVTPAILLLKFPNNYLW